MKNIISIITYWILILLILILMIFTKQNHIVLILLLCVAWARYFWFKQIRYKYTIWIPLVITILMICGFIIPNMIRAISDQTKRQCLAVAQIFQNIYFITDWLASRKFVESTNNILAWVYLIFLVPPILLMFNLISRWYKLEANLSLDVHVRGGDRVEQHISKSQQHGDNAAAFNLQFQEIVKSTYMYSQIQILQHIFIGVLTTIH